MKRVSDLKNLSPGSEGLELLGIDYLHFYVDSAQHWHDWFVDYLGFAAAGTSDDAWTQTQVVQQGAVRMVFSSALGARGPAACYLRQHPPGVAGIGLRVHDAERSLRILAQRGARVVQPLQALGSGRWGAIAAQGSLTYSLIERRDCGDLCVGYGFPACRGLPQPSGGLGLAAVDHLVLNLAAGELTPVAAWYGQVLGFRSGHRFEIKTPTSALRSEVMVFGENAIQIPLNEPSTPNSQIQEFLEVNRGPGVQHVALRTQDILSTVSQLRQRGVQFLEVPTGYYRQLRHNLSSGLSTWELDLEALAAAQILVDWRQEAPQQVLLQIFMQPLFGQPTFFFEIIERRAQAPGFGERNFQALFEAIEQEQRKRGSLH